MMRVWDPDILNEVRMLDRGLITVRQFIARIFGPNFNQAEARSAYWIYLEAGNRQYNLCQFDEAYENKNRQ